jgi:FecR protein
VTDDYLWNGSGEPDTEVSRLESVLRALRHNRAAPILPVVQRVRVHFWQKRWVPPLAAAAVLVLAVAAHFVWRTRVTPPEQAGWEVVSLTGSPRIDSRIMTVEGGKLKLGETIETDGLSRASLTVLAIGRVNVEPHTRLRLLQARPGHNQLSLERGTIHATIWAAPGEFAVNTPAAVAVDLGCRYTLHVDDTGAGLLRTTSGWVGFKLGDRESFIPAGAACATRPKIGPGTPYFEDASQVFREALAKFDFETGSSEQRRAELAFILTDARRRDVLTLWHLLARVNDEERGSVYERLTALIPPPTGVTREGILRLDRKMLDLWWNQLGLGSASWWRVWEHSWSEQRQSSR